MRLLLAILAILTSVPLLSAGEADVVFWNRDRSASFPDESYPWEFDGETGKNVLWKTPLPNWSNSGPIVHRGKVFLTSEPDPDKEYHPWLICIDAADGKELWRKALDAAEAFPAAQRDKVRAEVAEAWRLRQQSLRLLAKARPLYGPHKEAFDRKLEPPAEVAAEWNALKEELTSIGYTFGLNGRTKTLEVDEIRQGSAAARTERLRDLSMTWDHWGGTWTGIAFCTPVSDGERVYTLTTHNHYTAYTHDGELVWQRRFPRTTDQTVAAEQRDRIPAKGRWRPGWPGQGGFTTSPVMAEGLLLSCAGYMLRALDAKTGDVVWEKPYVVGLGQGMGVPSLVKVDGVTLMIAVGDGNNGDMPRDYGYPGDEIVRVEDGKTVGYLPGPSVRKGPSTGSLVVGDDFVVTKFSTGRNQSATAGFKLSWDDAREKIVATKAWEWGEGTKLPRGVNLFARSPWIDGKAYSGSAVVDLATGKVLQDHDKDWGINTGYMGHGGFIAGEAYVRWNLYGGKWVKRKGKENCAEYVAFDRESGALLGVGRIPVSPAGKKWMWVGAGTPYVADGRLYVRSFDYLWCIGR